MSSHTVRNLGAPSYATPSSGTRYPASFFDPHTKTQYAILTDEKASQVSQRLQALSVLMKSPDAEKGRFYSTEYKAENSSLLESNLGKVLCNLEKATKHEAQLESQLAKDKANYERELKIAKAAVEAEKLRAAEMQTRINQLNGQISAQKKNNEKLKESAAKTEAELKTVKRKFDEVKTDLTTQKEAYAKLIGEKEQEAKRQKIEIDELQAALNAQQVSFQVLGAAHQLEANRNAALQAKIDQATQMLNT